MIVLTFNEYDKLVEEALDLDIAEDYDYPEIDTIKELAICLLTSGQLFRPRSRRWVLMISWLFITTLTKDILISNF